MDDSAQGFVRASLGLVLAVLLTAGCGVIQRHAEVQPWVGRPVAELVQQRGQPTRIERDGRGNRVFVYEWTTEYASEVPGRVWRDAAGAVRWTNPTTETRYHRERQRYYVSPQDTIVDATWPIW
jgi:hypothetical protein